MNREMARDAISSPGTGIDSSRASQLASGCSVSEPVLDGREAAVSGGETASSRLTSEIGKRLFDICGALVIGILALPVIVVVAVAIRITGSPIVFSHTRIGRGHRPFKCYKFRSMIPDAERVLTELLRSDVKSLQEWRENHKLRNDPRVTKFGDFLRKSSLDELPQLWNVLKGDMSLVGPRPIVLDELERYGNKAQVYCSVRPGMTGLWQVLGRNHTTYSRRVSLDALYTRVRSIRVDCWIMLKTAVVVLRRVGAY